MSSGAIDRAAALAQLIDQQHANAICYSGYRAGQDPGRQIYPTYEQIREDLHLLAQHWSYIRLYDASPHAATTLQVIRNERLNLKVMASMYPAAEVSNPNCPWGADYSAATLAANRRHNDREAERLIALARQYPDIIFAVSIGNEASVEWTDHLVPVERLISFARRLKRTLPHPVTFCENYVPWLGKLAPLAAELDFISVHSYPVWEYHSIDTALAYTQENYYAVANRYPDKPVMITEAGWPTASNGRGIETWNASESLQATYYQQLIAWTTAERILTFVFEAFDEPWKGSPHPQEPEKHWGLFYVDRTPKPVMQSLFAVPR